MSTESMARKRPPDILDPFEGDQNVLKESAKSYASLSGNIKRKRLECPSSSTSCTPPVSSITPLPAIPLLYQLALSAHHSSQRHLQQAFIPSSVLCEADAGYPPIASTGQIPLFIHDARAHDKALGLLLLALDLLRIALASNELSDKERVAFTLEFGVVGVKLLAVFRPTAPLKGNEIQVEDKVDVERLMGDVQYAVASGLSIGRRHPYLQLMSQQLELLNARLAFMEEKGNLAKRLVRQALEAPNNLHTAHRYSLYLLLLEFENASAFSQSSGILDQLQLTARHHGHRPIFQLTLLIRLRLLFKHRQWDLILSALDDLATSINYDEGAMPATITSTWDAHFILHYLLLRCLWEGRVGNDTLVKVTLKKLYLLMDDTSDRGVFSEVRAKGGAIEIQLPGPSTTANGQRLLVQVTPPNVTYLLTFLATLVSRRDFMGTNSTCRSLVHARAMQEYQSMARADDMWDSDFSSCHGLADCIAMRSRVATIRAEVMMEEITALLYRSDFEAAQSLLKDVEIYLRSHALWQTFAPHLCLLYAQFAHLLGRTTPAVTCYHACRTLIKPGSELGLIVDICLLAVEGKLGNVLGDNARREEVQSVAERCRASSNAGLIATGYLLGSLTEVEMVASKKKLSAAYEESQRSNNNLLRILIFAFTTSTHHFGTRERMLRQLETGRDISMLLGGKDREDGIGQTVLGLWFAVNLRNTCKKAENMGEYLSAKESATRHVVRLNQLDEYGPAWFARPRQR